MTALMGLLPALFIGGVCMATAGIKPVSELTPEQRADRERRLQAAADKLARIRIKKSA